MDPALLLVQLIGPRGEEAGQPLGWLCEDVILRVWRWDGATALRGRERALDWLADEWHDWSDAQLEVFPQASDGSAAVQFRIQATENGRYVEHNRSIFFTYKDSHVHGIDLYCGAPIYSARRKDYIAPATLTEDQVRLFLEESMHGWDPREWMPVDRWRHVNRQVTRAGTGRAHPGSNYVGGARWTAEEADARIQELVEEHRRRGIGFTWWVMPFDTPADLPERLERHGLMLAGHDVRMARLGLDDLSNIQVNAELVVKDLDGTSDADIEDLLAIDAECFHLPPEQVDNMRATYHERFKSPEGRSQDLHCLAYLDGRPVGLASAQFRFGRMYLNGAATLPAYRGRHVYSTLLKRRLEAARERGYHLAAIDAGPMSKRIVEKYGFKDYGVIHVYGWMPEMDAAVIKTLVPDE